MNKLTLPLGISFSYLKGSLERLDELVEDYAIAESGSLQNLRNARIQLTEALDKFSCALLYDTKTNEIIKRNIKALGESLVTDSHTMLKTASSLLSSELKLL